MCTSYYSAALTVNGGDDDGNDDDESKPTCTDYIMHYLTIFWKLLFAIVPPTEIWGGWACFCVSIIMIGILTTFIGDLASHFGCTIGLKDSVTAITFVALGTSLPGMSAWFLLQLQMKEFLSHIFSMQRYSP